MKTVEKTSVPLIALVVYLRTMFPGLGAGVDAAKFQYIGSVLGTAHPPGYPLYIFVSYLFAKLPIGTLAYRMNLLSAVCGALACALVYAVVRQLGAARVVAAASALAMAFGRDMWSEALGAEVYSLAAALTALITLLAIRWAQSGRDRDLYLLTAAFALSLGNHLTVATLAPALVLFVFLSRPQSIRVRTVTVAAVIVVAGLAQYGYIVLRTVQHAPNLEARATNVRELVSVVRAERFSNQMFRYTPRELVTTRVPRIATAFVDEFGYAGLALLGLGAVALAWRRPATAVLLIGGAAGVTILTLYVDADVGGFLLPAFVLSWVIAGVGLDAAWTTVRAIAPRAQPVMAVLCLTLPVAQLVENYRRNDHHHRTYETRYFDAFFRAMGDRSALVRENYAMDQMFLYKLVGEGAAGGRAIELIAPDRLTVGKYAAAGYTIYAFAEMRATLEGLGATFEPVQLYETDRADARTAIDMNPAPLFKLTHATPCAAIGNTGWQEITDIAAAGPIVVKLDNYRPFDAQVTMYVATSDTSPSARRSSLSFSQGPGGPVESSATFHRTVSSEWSDVQTMLAGDGVPNTARLVERPMIERWQVRVNDQGQFERLAVAAPAHGDVVLMRASVDLDNPQRAIVCSWSGPWMFDGRTQESISAGADADVWFGQGWERPEAADGQLFRWMTTIESELLAPFSRVGALTIHVRAHSRQAVGAHLHVTMNGTTIDASTRLGPVWATYDFEVPASDLVVGLNRMILGVTPPPNAPWLVTHSEKLVAAVSDVTFELHPENR